MNVAESLAQCNPKKISIWEQNDIFMVSGTPYSLGTIMEKEIIIPFLLGQRTLNRTWNHILRSQYKLQSHVRKLADELLHIPVPVQMVVVTAHLLLNVVSPCEQKECDIALQFLQEPTSQINSNKCCSVFDIPVDNFSSLICSGVFVLAVLLFQRFGDLHICTFTSWPSWHGQQPGGGAVQSGQQGRGGQGEGLQQIKP